MLSGIETLKSELEAGRTRLMKNIEASIIHGNLDGATKQAELAIRISEELKNVERLAKLAQNVDEMQKKRKEVIINRDSIKQKIDDEEKDIKIKLEELKKEPKSKKKQLEADREKLIHDIRSLVKEAKPSEASKKVREAAKITDDLKAVTTSSESISEIQKIEKRLEELSIKRGEEDKKFEKEEVELITKMLPPVISTT